MCGVELVTNLYGFTHAGVFDALGILDEEIRISCPFIIVKKILTMTRMILTKMKILTSKRMIPVKMMM